MRRPRTDLAGSSACHSSPSTRSTKTTSRSSRARRASRARPSVPTRGTAARWSGRAAPYGTHYCDLTGEVDWARAMIDAHHDTRGGERRAHRPSCGFDSRPGSRRLLCTALQGARAAARQARLRVLSTKGGASGGIDRERPGSPCASRTRRCAPSSRIRTLCPPSAAARGPDVATPRSRRDADTGHSAAPVMAAINERVVRAPTRLRFSLRPQLHLRRSGRHRARRPRPLRAAAIGARRRSSVSRFFLFGPTRQLHRARPAGRGTDARGARVGLVPPRGACAARAPRASAGRCASRRSAIPATARPRMLAGVGARRRRPPARPAASSRRRRVSGARLADRLRSVGMVFEVDCRVDRPLSGAVMW